MDQVQIIRTMGSTNQMMLKRKLMRTRKLKKQIEKQAVSKKTAKPPRRNQNLLGKNQNLRKVRQINQNQHNNHRKLPSRNKTCHLVLIRLHPKKILKHNLKMHSKIQIQKILQNEVQKRNHKKNSKIIFHNH